MEKVTILLIFASFAVLEVIKTSFFRKKGQTRSDVIVEIGSVLALLLVTQPLTLQLDLAERSRRPVRHPRCCGHCVIPGFRRHDAVLVASPFTHRPLALQASSPSS